MAHPLVCTSSSMELERKHRTHSLEVFGVLMAPVLLVFCASHKCPGWFFKCRMLSTSDESSPFGILLGSVVRKGQVGNSGFSSEMTFPPSLERADSTAAENLKESVQSHSGMGRRQQQFPRSTVLQRSQEAWPGSCTEQFWSHTANWSLGTSLLPAKTEAGECSLHSCHSD